MSKQLLETEMKTSQVELLSIELAAKWASQHLKRDITESNISYLIQYGKIKKHGSNGSVLVSKDDLKKYYGYFVNHKEQFFKQKLGNDLNWALSFDHLKEKERTRHVHRLHPYKGKFIPQLVEYFIDGHINKFKKQVYFKKGDVILDPFAGSGTTIVQANELGIHAIGIDVSEFNCLIANCKMQEYEVEYLSNSVKRAQYLLNEFELDNKIDLFEKELSFQITNFNQKYFPNPKFKSDVYKGKVNEEEYSKQKEKDFLIVYNNLVHKYDIRLHQKQNSSFLDKWFIDNIRKEIDYVYKIIKDEKEITVRNLLYIILSRTVRSCRATTHFDLATLKDPQIDAYYCYKHKKMCKPLFSIKNMFNRYAIDSIERIKEFKQIKTNSFYAAIRGDSRLVNIYEEVRKTNKDFYNLLTKKKIKGIFSSPPYVGQIDYHEQHAYAYDLFGFKRQDAFEIGPLFKGQGIEARNSYIKGIADVLNNCKKYLSDDADIFLVANDKFNLYPEIAARSDMHIIEQFKRPVLNRTERDKTPYSEAIFHFKSL